MSSYLGEDHSIIEHGGARELNARTRDGATALYLAVHQRRTECACALIAAGADVNLKYDGVTPLMKAATDGNLTIVNAIISSGRANLYVQRSLRSQRSQSDGAKAYVLANEGGHKDCAMVIARAILMDNISYMRYWPKNIQDLYFDWYTQYDKSSTKGKLHEMLLKALIAIKDDNTKCFLANQILHCKDTPLHAAFKCSSPSRLVNSAIEWTLKQLKAGPLFEVRSIFEESRKRLEASGNYYPYSIPCDSKVGDNEDESKHDDSVVEAAVIAQPLMH